MTIKAGMPPTLWFLEITAWPIRKWKATKTPRKEVSESTINGYMINGAGFFPLTILMRKADKNLTSGNKKEKYRQMQELAGASVFTAHGHMKISLLTDIKTGHWGASL